MIVKNAVYFETARRNDQKSVAIENCPKGAGSCVRVGVNARSKSFMPLAMRRPTLWNVLIAAMYCAALNSLPSL